MTGRLVATSMAAAMVVAPVQAACWTGDEAAAASVRQLQSMLMVTALRCQAAGSGIMADYNQFVAANRLTLAAGNDRIRAHFVGNDGVIPGQRAYDGFTTALANAFGAGDGAPTSCAAAADLAREASAMAGSRDALLMLADRLHLDARLPDGRCEARTATMADARPTGAALRAASLIADPAAGAAPAPRPVLVAAVLDVADDPDPR